MKMFYNIVNTKFMLLLLLLIVVVNAQNSTLLIPEAYICSAYKTDFCLGVSTGNRSAIAGQLLQIKQRFNNIVYASEQKIQWNIYNDHIEFSGASVAALSIAKLQGGTRAILHGQSNVLFQNNNTVILDVNSTKCLTVMKCDMSLGGYCNPYSDNRVLKTSDIKRGAYLRFKPCSNDHISQDFVINPPCAPNCTDSMLIDTKCNPECNVRECFYDFGYCDTIAPTTSNETYVPTTMPVFGNMTNSPTTLPSFGNMTNSPSSTPTITISIHPSTSVPTKQNLPHTGTPTKTPTKTPTHTPTSNPTKAQTTVPTSPIVKTTTQPTTSPTTHVLSENDIYAIVFGIVGFLILIIIIVVCVIRDKNKKAADRQEQQNDARPADQTDALPTIDEIGVDEPIPNDNDVIPLPGQHPPQPANVGELC